MADERERERERERESGGGSRRRRRSEVSSSRHHHHRRSSSSRRHGGSSRRRSRRSRSRSRSRSPRKSEKDVKEQASHIAKVLQETGRVVGYEDEENPFGDTNLSQAFVWHKKIEKQIHQGTSEKAFSADEVKGKHEDRLKEIEQVKKRRLERDRELAQRQEELDFLQKERVLAEAAELEEKEEAYHTEQARTRSEIRLKRGRAKPVDILYEILNDLSDTYVSPQDPCVMLENLSVLELQELQRELQSHIELDAEDESKSKYWRSVLKLSSHFLLEQQKQGDDPINAQASGVHRSLESEIRGLLEGKGTEELETLEQDIANKLELGTTGDEEYWGVVLQKVQVHLARASVLAAYNQKLKKLEDKAARLKERLAQEKSAAAERGDVGSNDAKQVETFKGRLMEEEGFGDENFNQEVQLDRKSKGWHDKYQARKPRYFNRVHTGFEWTKYNRTHYDYDNPPPKVVKGYKFNIFYQDLVDKSKAPAYKIEKDPDSEDSSTCIIKFTAGAPYDDIAFRIVNKEWEYGHKRGFKCNFQRGILRLYFHFKRSRYRK